MDVVKYKNEYNKENYSRISATIPKEKKEIIAELMKKHNKSVSRLIIEALEKTYHIDLTIVESKLKQSK